MIQNIKRTPLCVQCDLKSIPQLGFSLTSQLDPAQHSIVLVGKYKRLRFCAFEENYCRPYCYYLLNYR